MCLGNLAIMNTTSTELDAVKGGRVLASTQTRFYSLPESLLEDIGDYERLVSDFLGGSIDSLRMKNSRVPMGVYEQRTDGAYMLRVRLPGGDITPGQLEAVTDIAQRHSPGAPLHITTRQDLQIHDLRLKDTPQIMRELADLGLSSRGGGGNTVRNIVGSWDSGFSPGEAFDVAPYVRALTTRMIAEKDSWSLPRKFKIAFSSSSSDTAYAMVTDLGFVAARNADGSRGFQVYAAGGMGGRPCAGIRLFGFVQDHEIYGISAAAKRLFDRHGNREDRCAARLRFLRYQWGDEKFRERFAEVLAEVRSENPAPLDLLTSDVRFSGFVRIPVFLGDLSFGAAGAIARIARHFGSGSLRFTPRQNVIIRNIPEREIAGVRQELTGEGLLAGEGRISHNAVACAGAGACRLGICLSRELVKAIGERMDNSANGLSCLRVNISGCPNSCGQHLLADIGFCGGAARQHDRQIPVYTVVAGGETGGEGAKLAEAIGRIPARHVPEFLSEVVTLVSSTRAEWESFREWSARNREALKALAERHRQAAFPSENSSVYRDWGTDSEFSVSRKQS